MASLNELTYNLLNIFRGGMQSDDEPVSKKQIAFQIGYYRAMLIKRELDKNRTLDRRLIQDLGCIDLTYVDRAECCDITWDCEVARTVDRIPQPVESSDSALLTFVGLIDKVTPIEYTSKSQAHWSKYNKYTSKSYRAYYHNGYIYIANATRLKYINVQGVFADPESAATFSQCDGSPCFTWDSQYPIAEYMIQPITEMIMTKEARLITNTPNDQTNDGEKEPPKATN
jgi:hypothetical protein